MHVRTTFRFVANILFSVLYCIIYERMLQNNVPYRVCTLVH